MTSVKHIVDGIGRDVLCQELEVGKAAVSDAVAADQFPARWYRVVRRLGVSAGIPCPDDLFGFIAPRDGPTA